MKYDYIILSLTVLYQILVTLVPKDKVEKAFSFSSKPQLLNTYIIMKVLSERLKSIIKLEYRVLGIMISFKNACNASSFVFCNFTLLCSFQSNL